MKQVDLARKLGMSESSVSRWESEDDFTMPPTATLHRICAALDITIQQFWGELPEVTAKEAS